MDRPDAKPVSTSKTCRGADKGATTEYTIGICNNPWLLPTGEPSMKSRGTCPLA
jgi:hypothetical protein